MKKPKRSKYLVIIFLVLTLTIQANSQNLQEIPVIEVPNNQQLAEIPVVAPLVTSNTTLPTGNTVLETNSTSSTSSNLPQNNQSAAIASLPQEKDQTLQEDQETTPEAQQQTINLQPLLPGPKGSGNMAYAQAPELGENWERTCENGICTHTLYPYQKYYQEKGVWTLIDESFYSSGCQTNYNFCVTNNLYHAHVKTYPNATNAMTIERNGLTFTFTPNTLHYTYQQNKQSIGNIHGAAAQVTRNKAAYPSAFLNDVDLQFIVNHFNNRKIYK